MLKNLLNLPGMEQEGLELEKENTPNQEISLSIISPREYDSLGTLKWREYLNAQRSAEAWRPPGNSSWKEYARYQTIQSIDEWSQYIKPRYSDGERVSIIGITNLI
ncbi:MAG: hypothetical protein N2558_02105 [Patescibacteria group bacterium]|nr:hypothetical protein [Patescibacteria group bacterium]